MARVSAFSSPLMLGFDQIERLFDQVSKSSDGYPPYNIERLSDDQTSHGDVLRITLAIAGFSREELEVTAEENQLTIRGRQKEEGTRHYLHRGIAKRQFQKVFLLADGMEILGADLKNGLLNVDLIRPQPERIVRQIDIKTHPEDTDQVGLFETENAK
ncbi:MAG: heat-shock protein Hsp20 [Hyphomicrobiales bacterium]|nr:MAG: heat-shock protein Hsp20 [Hyphomicrobiales bacterium]